MTSNSPAARRATLENSKRMPWNLPQGCRMVEDPKEPPEPSKFERIKARLLARRANP